MKYFQLFLWGLGYLFLSSEANSVVGERDLSAVSDKGTIYQAKNFKCPLVFGAFPDPDDCAYYYVCVAGISVHKKCGMLQHFDVLRRRCMPMIVAICGIDKKKTTSSVTSTTSGDNFKCPKFMGSFPHPNDCSKYYNCIIYVPNLKTCPENQLFDTAKSSCKPEKEVDCDTRQRPGFLTSAIPTEPTTTEVSETNSIEEVITQTTAEIIGTEEITQSTIDISSTIRPTGPPDHTCDEEDVDCIITETGDIEDWFICPQDIGSFPHPSSDKLFIFCMNWIPSVKKCGLELVYSKEMSTCIETTDFV